MIEILLTFAFFYCIIVALCSFMRVIYMTINNKWPDLKTYNTPQYIAALQKYLEIDDRAFRLSGIAIMHLMAGLLIGMVGAILIGGNS